MPRHFHLLAVVVAAVWLLAGFTAAVFAAAAPAGSSDRGPSSAGPSTAPAETPQQRDARMKWWRDARFGMFIHWGLYAIPAGEWNGVKSKGGGEWIMHDMKIPVADYEKLARKFNPARFDARKWARIAKDAGMKYVVITTKHHDGFCLFDSDVGNYDVIDSTPFRRDVMREIADAVRDEGLTICWYHSILDWHHADAQTPERFPLYFEHYLKPQVKEILTNYGDIGVIWFDGEWISQYTAAEGRDLYAWCRSIAPKVIVNNRVGKGRAGMEGMNNKEGGAGDFGTPEQEVPATGFGPGVDWESCMTMNDTWGFKTDDHHWKSAPQLIRTLIDIASKGGNYLLNVGPTADGEIPPESIERLAAIGRWMKVNGDSIYGTTASPFAHLSFGRATSKPGRLYLHVFDWPADHALSVPLRSDVKKAYLMSDPATVLSTRRSEAGTVIELPSAAPDAVASVIVVEIKGPPDVISPASAPAGKK
jgi:alpha-L-fucosidase